MAMNHPFILPRRRATDRNLSIELQLLSLAYQNLPAMLIVNITATMGAGYVLHSENMPHVGYWVTAVIVLSVLRFATWIEFTKKFRRNQITNLKTVRSWKTLFAIGLFSAAVLWVAMVLATFGVASYNLKFTLIIIISALAGGATGIIAPLKYIGRLYITLLLLTTSIILYLISKDDLVIASLGIIFWLAMILSHRNNHSVLRQSLTLQQENKLLINNLQELNNHLEKRVAERTEALRRIAHYDVLTGLPNRRGLIEWMESGLNENIKQEAAILFLDLDRFKQINDALGHDIGDKVLQTIAYRFKELCPDNSILGRWGGDEFLIITHQQENSRLHAEKLAKKLIEVATAPLEMNNEILGLGLSVGIAYFPTDASNYKDVIHAADLTVAEVKRSGRGQTLTYNETYVATQRRRFDLSRALSDAITDNTLSLVYQPIVNSQSGEVTALEALTRWRHSLLGDINPEEFIHLAEDTDKIIALGDWVLNTACHAAASWKISNPFTKIAVNVSLKQLLANDFSEKVYQTLQRYHLKSDDLILEVTESLFGMEYHDSTLTTVTELRQSGIEVQIDDFGIGYSSLSRLHEFPVTAIKIDRSFIHQLDKQGAVIVESAIMIAKRMNLKVTAEGVETIEQATILTKLGVDNLQGFYFSRPQKIPVLNPFAVTWLN
jgi:diguanylate cyclase